VYDTGEHDGLPYIVMERLPGETLADRIAAGPVDPVWLRQVACEVLDALATAHAAGLVHRDVKPGNILLTADGHAKIADFGIAKSLEGSSDTLDLTGTGQLLGTPAYLPPERLDGALATARSDLYSLGVVLYEALAGVRPFPGDTPLATARAVVAGDFRPLRELRPDLDPTLVATVERAMATDPDRRFASAGAMAAALSLESHVPPAAGTPTVVDGLGVEGLGAPATSILESNDLRQADAVVVPPAPVARPPFRVPLALVVAVAFIALLVYGLNRGGGSGSTASSAGQSESTTAAPTTTAAPSPTAALADELRAVAGRLGPADGARAADLAAALRQVADQVQAGNAGPAATGAVISAGAWRLTGQLTDAAATSAIALLSRVPGVTVVNLPGQPVISPVVPATPAPSSGNGKAKGKEKD
jgi:serine/threonine-protein kinase